MLLADTHLFCNEVAQDERALIPKAPHPHFCYLTSRGLRIESTNPQHASVFGKTMTTKAVF